MKKLFAILLAAALFASPSAALASDSGEAETTQETAAPAETPLSEIPAKSGVLMDAATGTVLFEKEAHTPMAPASITKIMTMLLVMEEIQAGNLTMQDRVTCSANAASMGGTQIWLKEGEQMTVQELMKATAVASANDAATALAEHVGGGSEEAFVERMNARAAELGMNDTLFCNPTGLDAEGHVSSAYDVALMSRALLQFPEITQFTTIWMDSLREGRTELVNTNKLVRFYKGCTGLKTGTTSDAGSCVSASAARGKLHLISVVMGCRTSAERFSSARQLLDYGFSHYTMFETSVSKEQFTPVKVKHGVLPEVSVEVDASSSVILEKGREKLVAEEITLEPEVEAPVEPGQVLGRVRLMLEGEELASFEIRAAEKVERMTFGRAFGMLFERMAGL